MLKLWHSSLQTMGLACAGLLGQSFHKAHSAGFQTDYQITTGQCKLSEADDPEGSGQTPQHSMPRLLQILEDGSFFETINGEWKLDFRKDILPIIKDDFKHELPRLKRARADQNGIARERSESFGVLLYGTEDGEEEAMTYYELDRTLTAVQALRWIRDGKLEDFNKDLSQESWEWIIARFNEPDAKVFEKQYAEECLALITSVIINDLGKDPDLARDYREIRPDEDITTDNHDMQLDKAIKAGMVPCLDWLRPDLKDDILLGVHISGECNLGQLAQAEDVPASLYPLMRFRTHKRAWHFRFMEQIVDLAGARGHFDNTYALVFTEAVARGNRSAHKVASNIIWNNVSPVKAYNDILLGRYTMLQDRGYTTHLTILNPHHRALMRLFCLSGASSSETAALLETSLRSLHPTTLTSLIISLNATGLPQPTIQITYSPALLSGALSHPFPTTSSKISAISAVLTYMDKCFYISGSEQEEWSTKGITVIERDIFEVVARYVKTEKFMEDPSGLLEREVPVGAVVNRREEGWEGDYGV